MQLMTGNDLASGEVIWWTGSGWSRHICEAVDVGAHGETIMAAEEGARRVNAPYLVAAHAAAEGPRPNHIKDRVRATGPTVRPDLSLPPPDQSVGDWVI